MKRKVVYEANDGKLFDSALLCRRHEQTWEDVSPVVVDDDDGSEVVAL